MSRKGKYVNCTSVFIIYFCPHSCTTFAFTDIDASGKDTFKKCSDNLDGTEIFITSNLKIMASHLRVCRHKIKQLNGQGKKRQMDKDQMVKSCGIISTK